MSPETQTTASKTPENLVSVTKQPRPDGDTSTCLRPLGLCELGGCCDACWYSPEHPRFKKA